MPPALFNDTHNTRLDKALIPTSASAPEPRYLLLAWRSGLRTTIPARAAS